MARRSPLMERPVALADGARLMWPGAIFLGEALQPRPGGACRFQLVYSATRSPQQCLVEPVPLGRDRTRGRA